MSWPRGSLLAALLVLSVPLACADTITVNTTTDDNAVNSLCSLREAVEYVNRDRPKGGFQGCVASAVSDLDSITLPVNTDPYLILNKAIVIQRGLSISGASNNATERTIIKVEGAHRAFVINDAPVFLPPAVSPAGAPWLDPSDAGATGLNLTTTKEPLIMGQLASASVPVSPTMVTVYDVAEDGTKTSVGTTTSFSAGGNWSVQSALSLSPGLHKMVFTTRDATDLTNLGVESTDSPALGLAIYVLIDTREVSLSQIEIIGCVTTLITDCADNVDESALVAGVQTTPSGLTFKNIIANTANNGGIIYLNEALSLNGVTLHEGAAKFGGAIYADAGGSLKVYTSIFRENAATDGGGAFFIKNNSGK